MNRRTFLIAGAAAARVLGANDRINMAVIGVGGRGRSHVGKICELDGAHLAAVCDVNQAQTERAVQIAAKAQVSKPKVYSDMRKMFEDKDIDAVSIATPNHWHALSAIWACQAGKDVYVEKPASHNIHEGEKLVEAARKYKRMVQVGMQSRSTPHFMKAIELIQGGALGDLYMAKGLCFKRRQSIGHAEDEPVPAGVDWDMFLGPAPKRPFNKLRFIYNWHWFWDTGDGDIGNQGIHEMDIARWGLNLGLPKSAVSAGGKYLYDDDQETPNTQFAALDYGDKQIQFEVRGLITPGEANVATDKNTIGDIFFGSKGTASTDRSQYQLHLGEERELGPNSLSVKGVDGTGEHFKNFLSAVRSRNHEELRGEARMGADSMILVHMANIAYRLGRKVNFDSQTRKFINDPAANRLAYPEYREPYVVPDKV